MTRKKSTNPPRRTRRARRDEANLRQVAEKVIAILVERVEAANALENVDLDIDLDDITSNQETPK